MMLDVIKITMKSLQMLQHTYISLVSAFLSYNLCISMGLFFFFLIYFIYLFLAALGLRCCMWTFSSCGKRGLLLSCGARASHCGGFSCCGAWALGMQASVVVALGLSSCGLWTLECRFSSCGTWA